MPEDKKDNTVLSWKAPEFFHYKKSFWWFPIQAVITLGLVTYFVLTKQYIVAIIIVLSAIIIYRLAHEEPEVLPVVFSSTGVKFKGQFFPFQSLKSFWIIDAEGAKRLYLQQIERFNQPVVIPIVKQDTDKIRAFLRTHLPETQNVKEDIADRLNRFLRI